MKLNLSTESLARGAALRPWATIGVWLAILVAAVMLSATLLGDALTTEEAVTSNPESEQASNLLEERLGGSEDTMDEMVIVRSTTLTVDDPDYQNHVEELFADLTALGDEVVLGGAHYYLTGDESLVSADRSTTIIPVVMPEGVGGEEVDLINGVVNRAGADGSFEVLIMGEATLMAEIMEMAEKDLRTGESIGISVALIVLTLVFGAIAAALLPMALAIAAIAVALGATALVGQVYDLVFFVTNIITMMGLAVGIDYSLFIVSRYREERERGLDKLDAITTTGATASRAILFSGMTVVLALAGMLILPVSTFRAIGIGAILVVIVAVLASLTLLPAILSLLGDRVNAWRIPLIQRRKTGRQVGAGGGFWDWMARGVMRRPVISLVLAGGLLVAVATPYFDINLGSAGISSLPDGLKSKDAFIVLQDKFGFGQDMPAQVVIDGQTDAPDLQAAIERLQASVASDPAFILSGL
ncbi:MAG: MMPL family transporter [Dehalococcoidia bacterium]